TIFNLMTYVHMVLVGGEGDAIVHPGPVTCGEQAITIMQMQAAERAARSGGPQRIVRAQSQCTILYLRTERRASNDIGIRLIQLHPLDAIREPLDRKVPIVANL